MSHRTRYMPTVAAYDAWASTYDSDGNMLQKMDDLELATLLPAFLSLVNSSVADGGSVPTAATCPVRVLDLGCGTGRNTRKLLDHDWRGRQVEIIGLDASDGMLGVAREKLSTGRQPGVRLELVKHDFVPSLGPSNAWSTIPVMPTRGTLQNVQMDGVLSTLVLEHFPSVKLFFAAISGFLKPGGLALVTNMHKEMGEKGGAAGFVVEGGEKVRGSSFLYSVKETVRVAKEEGLEAVVLEGEGEDGVRERGVSEELLGLLGERGRKWVGVMVWYSVVLRKIA